MTSSPLTPYDAAIWHTCQINELIDAKRFTELPEILTPFAPANPAERVLTEGVFVLKDFAALGNGTYHHDGGFFFATGGVGLALTAGLAAGRAIGNSRRRSAARAAAVPRWRDIDRGTLFVSTHGFRMQSASGLHTWAWSDLASLQLTAPGEVALNGTSERGPVTWILQTHWAELVFTLWCRVRHPRHPQFINGAWVPPGWGARVGVAGTRPPQYFPETSQLGQVFHEIEHNSYRH